MSKDLIIGVVGDPAIGKTSLIVQYVEERFDEDYIQTLGVTFLQKTVQLNNNNICFAIWDLGGAGEFNYQLSTICQNAQVILFAFDLSRDSTLLSIKDLYKQVSIPFIIGTKYDLFREFPKGRQDKIIKRARKFATAMRAPLIFCSASQSINVQNIFKVIISKVFQLECLLERITDESKPLLEF